MGQALATVMCCGYDFMGSEKKVLVLGMGGAGKTTSLMRLKHSNRTLIMPTVGYNTITLETIAPDNIVFWDLGGGSRDLWPENYPGTSGIMFFIDSSNPDSSFKQELGLLNKMIGASELEGCPRLLVLLHKKDLRKESKQQYSEDKDLVNRIAAEICQMAGGVILETDPEDVTEKVVQQPDQSVSEDKAAAAAATATTVLFRRRVVLERTPGGELLEVCVQSSSAGEGERAAAGGERAAAGAGGLVGLESGARWAVGDDRGVATVRAPGAPANERLQDYLR